MDEGTRFREILHLMQKNVECAICLELLKNPVSTKCDHQFCKFCIIKFIGKQRYVPCPLCKESISKRSLQERPELEIVVNRVKDLIGAFNSDASKDEEKDVSSKGIVSCAQESAVTLLNAAPMSSKAPNLPRDDNSIPTKRALDYSEDFSELDLAAEGDLQKYLSKNLAESATRRSRGRSWKIKTNTNCTDENQVPIEFSKMSDINSHQGKENLAAENEYKNNDKEDLLRYIEEGSCGAVWDNDSKSHKITLSEASKSESQDVDTCCNGEIQDQLNAENSNMKNNCVTRKKQPGARVGLPMSPTKLNIKTRSVSRGTCSKIHPDNVEAKEGKYNSEQCVTPAHQENLFSVDIGVPITPDSDTASISSTQQLMKPMPVVSRTYSKIMKTFQADGGLRNWKKTLPSPHAGATSNDEPELKGLTTKEKIALKKKKKAPISLLKDASTHNSNFYQSDIYNANPDLAFGVSDEPLQKRRRNIFKSRCKKSQNELEKGLLKVCTDDEVKDKDMEDPYEFHGSQTPKKNAKEIPKCGRRSRKGLRSVKKSTMSQPLETELSEAHWRNSVVMRSKENELTSKNNVGEYCSKSKKIGVHSGSEIEEFEDSEKTKDCVDDSNVDSSKGEKSKDNPSSCSKHIEVQQQKTKKVCFADEQCENKMQHNDASHSDHLMKPCSQETNFSSLKSDMSEIDKLLPESKISEKGEFHVAGKSFKKSTKVFCGEAESIKNDDEVQSKDPLEHVQPIDDIYQEEADKSGMLTQSKLLEIVQHKTVGLEQNINSFKCDHLENMYEDTQITKEAPKQKRGMKRKQGDENKASYSTVGRRNLSRRQRNASSIVDSEAEMAKMAHIINEAEDHDFAFCTQEARMKMQEEQDKKNLYREAFGFDMLLQEQDESLLIPQNSMNSPEHQILKESDRNGNQNVRQYQESSNLKENEKADNCLKDLYTTSPKNMKRQMDSLKKIGEKEDCGKHDTNLKSNQIKNKLTEQQMLKGTGCDHDLRQCQGSSNLTEEEKADKYTKDLATPEPETIKKQITSLKRVAEKENGLAHNKCPTLKAKEIMSFQSSGMAAAGCHGFLKTASFNTRPSNRSPNSIRKEVLSRSKFTNATQLRATQFSQPNVNLMVQFFPSTSHLGSTPKEISASADDVVLETPNVAGLVTNSFQCKSRAVHNDENSASNMPHNASVQDTHLTYPSGCKKNISQNEHSGKIPKRDVETKEVDEAITFAGSTNEPEERAYPVTNVKPVKAFCSKFAEDDKLKEHTDCLQKSRTDEPYQDDAAFEDGQEVDYVDKDRDKNISNSSCGSSSCDAKSEDAGKKNVLAIDTMCFDCDKTGQDDDNDAKTTVPDSLQVQDSEIREDQLDKQTEIGVIEETQGTEETCIPVSTPHEVTRKTEVKILDSKLDIDENSFNELSQKILKREIGDQISCFVVNSASSQPILLATKCKTAKKVADIDSNSCLMSQSILQTNKSPNNTSKSNNTNIVSSCSTGIILPTAQEKKFIVTNVSQNLDSESQKSDRMLCKSDPKAFEKLIKDSNPIQGQLSADENDEDDCEDYDEDAVLMMNRPKRRCFSLESEMIKPVVYKASNSCTKHEVHLDKNEGDAEMLGETQALDVLETESQDVENATFQGTCFERNHTENISFSCEQMETIVETEHESAEIGPNSAEDNSDPLVELAPQQKFEYVEEVEKCLKEHGNSISPNVCQKQVKSTCHENSKLYTNPHVLPHLTVNVMEKEQNLKRMPLEAIKSVKKDQSLRESKDIITEKSKSSYSLEVDDNTSDPGQNDKPKNFTSVFDAEISIVSVESARTRRTRRGLAAKLTNNDEAQSLVLSVGAQEAIRRSVEETKSKLEALSNADDKILSEPISEVIDLDVETEQIMYEQIDSHNNQRSKQATSPNNVNKEVSTNLKHPHAKLPSKEKLYKEPLKCGGTISKVSPSLLPGKDRTDGVQLNNTTDQVMSDLKACFDSSNDDSGEDENWNPTKHRSSASYALHNSVKKRKATAEDGLNLKSPTRSYLSPLASSPADGLANTCQPDPPERSIITGIEESPVESDNDCNEEDEDEGLGATVRGKKRLRQQISSDSDEPDEEEQSQSKSSVSSVLSSQAEILSTQQAQALEGDVDKLRKEIAIYEAKLGAQPVLDSGDAVSSDDEEQEEDEHETVKDADSAALCKRLPDVFMVDESPVTASEKVLNAHEEEKSEDDLFVSPLSPSPPSRKTKVKFPAPKRPKLAEPATQVSENFLKQFHSPGGTIRSKKQLDFVQSSMSSFVSRSGSKTQTKSPGKEKRENLRHRPSSPVLSSQRSKLLQGKNTKEAGSGNIEKSDRKICFVTSGLTKKDNALALALAKNMGLVVSPRFTKDVTHVVMRTESDQRLVCDRTLKFFQGIAHKCWVLAFSWIERSLSQNRLLPEADFEITGDTSAGEFAGGVRRSRQSDQPLFAHFCFACVGTSQEMPKESLSELLTLCGASCVEDPVALMSQIAKHKIIVRCSDSDAEPSVAELDMFNGLYKHMSLVTVMREWILDSLGSYALQPMASYVLNTGGNIVVPF